MASKTTALLLLALFGATVFLQVALASEAVDGDVVTTPANANMGDADTTPWDDQEAVLDQFEEIEDDLLPDVTELGIEGDQLGEVEVQPYLYVPEAGEVDTSTESPHDVDEQQEAISAAVHPLARILTEQPSKKCFWGDRKCHWFYKWHGCCQRTCVNLANNNRHCGRCGKCCDTKRGYFCQSGKCCKKSTLPSLMCSKTKRCLYGKTCCGGKCVDVKSDCENCGMCSRNCGWGNACCGGKCKNLKSDFNNCGKCGRMCGNGQVCCSGKCSDVKTDSNNCGMCGKRCGWGSKCCKGKCINTQWDSSNCGNCGKKCVKKCKYGICGYGQ